MQINNRLINDEQYRANEIASQAYNDEIDCFAPLAMTMSAVRHCEVRSNLYIRLFSFFDGMHIVATRNDDVCRSSLRGTKQSHQPCLRSCRFVIGGMVLFMLIIAILTGCRSTKEISTTGGVTSLKPEAEFFVALKEKSFYNNTLSARIQFEITLSSGNTTSSRAQLKMLKDEKLQISVQPLLGIEALRAELTPDSIKIVNRLNRWYMIDAFDNIKGETAMDFNFHNLQALISNRLFLPGEESLSDEQFNRFRWEQTPTGYVMRTSDRTGLLYAFTADANERLGMTAINDPSSLYALHCTYEDFRPVNQLLFPMQVHIRLTTENEAQQTLSLQFSRVEFDIPLEMNFPIPANYQRVSLQQILYSIEQL